MAPPSSARQQHVPYPRVARVTPRRQRRRRYTRPPAECEAAAATPGKSRLPGTRRVGQGLAWLPVRHHATLRRRPPGRRCRTVPARTELTFACAGDNDLFKALRAGGSEITRCASAGTADALAAAKERTAAPVLADGWRSRTSTTGGARRAEASCHVRQRRPAVAGRSNAVTFVRRSSRVSVARRRACPPIAVNPHLCETA